MATGDELRSVMRRYPHGVAVVTVDRDGERMGLTASSLVSLSVEPPLVGVALSRHSALLELVRGAGAFALSLLAADQTWVAQHFARGVPPIAHWHGIEMIEGEVAPLIAGAVGWIECRVAAEHLTGDHALLVGEVVVARTGRSGPALAYREQVYTEL